MDVLRPPHALVQLFCSLRQLGRLIHDPAGEIFDPLG